MAVGRTQGLPARYAPPSSAGSSRGSRSFLFPPPVRCGVGMRPGSFAAAVRHSASISQQNPLEVKLDGGFWRCAADERVAFGWRVQRLWRIGEFASDQATFAVVAYARSARPTHRNGAGFRQLEQAAEAGVPWDSETASHERHDRPAARRTVRTMRQSCGDAGDAWCKSGRGPKQFDGP